MTELLFEVYEAFKAGGVPDAEAKAAAAILSDRVNGVKSYGIHIAETARAENKQDIRELAAVMREGFELIRVEMKNLRMDMKAGDDALRAEIKAGDDALRAEMKAMDSGIRADMKAMDTSIRADIKAELAPMKADIATLKVNMAVVMWMLGLIVLTLVVPAVKQMLGL
jgi:hypothetical protein